MNVNQLLAKLRWFKNEAVCRVNDDCVQGFVAGAQWGWGDARVLIGKWLDETENAGGFVLLTPDQFRKFTRTAWDEAFFEGERHAKGGPMQGRSPEEIFEQSRTAEYLERMVEIDCPTGETR